MASSSSSSSFGNIARRMLRLPFHMIEGLSRVIGTRTNFEDLDLGHQQDNLQYDVPEEWHFLTLFERKFGGSHPFFYACRFDEVLKIAKNENKFVFVYLHAPDVLVANTFCRDTLCSDLVIPFLDENFISWGAYVDREEGYKIAIALKANSFPFCAVVAPNSDETMAVLQQVEGPVSPQELVEILQKTLEEQGAAFRAMKREEEERIRANRQLREEQDAAYQAALQLDKEKEKARELQREQEARAEAKARVKEHERAKTKAEVPKKLKDEMLHHKPDPNQTKGKQTLKEVENLKRSTPPKQPSHKGKELSKETRGKDITPYRKTQPFTKILVRFPNGERLEQSFQNTDTIRSIYKYIDSLDMPGLGSYRLIFNFPRKVYGYEQLDMTLTDAGLHPNAALFLERY